MRLLPAIFAGLVLSFSAAPTVSAAKIEVETFKLANGLQVLVIPDHRAPVVTHMVYYNVGSADEPEGLSGIAHFLEHLMFKRTKKLKDGEFSQIVAENGGEHNAFTSYDMTAYYQSVAVDRLELMMSLEADRMTGLNLKPEDIASEREVIIEERRLRTDNNPSALMSEQMMAALFLSHPYGTPVIGWKHEMEGLAFKPIMDFYDAHYTPHNAYLIVAGDVTADKVKKLAEKTYGKVRGPEIAPRQRVQEPDPVAARRVILEDARVRQPEWERIYLAPGYRQTKRDEAKKGQGDALTVLAQILGGGTTSRLYKKLVIDDKIATDAGAYYYGSAYDDGFFGVHAQPVPGGNAEVARARLSDIERAMDTALTDLLAKGVTAAELERAKRQLLAAEIYAQDSSAALARVFGRALTTGLTVDDVLNWSDRINAVTVDAVLAVAQQVIQARGSVTGLLLPEDPKTPVGTEPALPAPAPSSTSASQQGAAQ